MACITQKLDLPLKNVILRRSCARYLDCSGRCFWQRRRASAAASSILAQMERLARWQRASWTKNAPTIELRRQRSSNSLQFAYLPARIEYLGAGRPSVALIWPVFSFLHRATWQRLMTCKEAQRSSVLANSKASRSTVPVTPDCTLFKLIYLDVCGFER